MHHLSNDIVGLIAGIFLYGIRASISKWLVAATWKLLRAILLQSERDVIFFFEMRNIHLERLKIKRLNKWGATKDCIITALNNAGFQTVCITSEVSRNAVTAKLNAGLKVAQCSSVLLCWSTSLFCSCSHQSRYQSQRNSLYAVIG